MIMTVMEARDILRLDGPDNDNIIIPLLETMPDYLEVTTGYTPRRVTVNKKHPATEYSPLAVTTAKFLLQLWYNAEGTDTYRLQRTIDNLLAALSATVTRGDNHGK